MSTEVIRYRASEVCEMLGIQEEFLVRCVRDHWIEPASPEESTLDEEDLSRLALIQELQQDLGVNDEAIPIILHLVDQLHYLRGRIRDQYSGSLSG